MRKGLSLLVIIFLLSSLFTWARPTYALTAATVTVNPAVGGKVASYSIQFTLGSSAAHALPSTGYIKITFPTGTKLPSGSINKSYVTVNAVNPATDPTISSSTVKILIPSPLASSTVVTVAFTSSAQIQNPSSPTGMLKLKVETGYVVGTADTVIEAGVDSNKYFIGYPAVITPTPNTDNSVYEIVEYKLEWKTGNEGALVKNESTITLVFDPSYTLPTWTGLGYIPASYIRVNNTQLLSNAVCSAAPLTITFKTPVDVAVSTTVTILLTIQIGLQNPAPGEYAINISSNVEPTVTPSQDYTITDAVAFIDLLTPTPAGIQGVVVDPPATSAEASYKIGISVDIPLSANISMITYAFPTSVQFPTTISASAVTFDVNGTITPLTVNPVKNNTLVSITVPVNILVGDLITVTFDRSLKIKNPSTAGLYSIQAMTSAQPFYRPSPQFAIGTAVTDLKITPSPNTNDEDNVRYDIEFKLGANGALTKNVDQIIVFLPIAAPIPPVTLNASSVLVGTDYTIVPTDVQTPLLTDNVPPGYKKFIITPPKDITASQTVKISILPSAGLKNPAVAGSFKGYAHTSKEPILVDSALYTITDAVKINSVVVEPPSAGVEAKYTITIVTAQALTKDIDSITVAFPTGTTVPSNITPGNVTINAIPVSLPLTTSGTIITMIVPVNIPAAAIITIVFTIAAKVKNPSTAGIYKLQVKTSAQPDYRVSPIYGIGSSVTGVKVTPQPDTKSTDNVIYVVEFKLGANGALTANTDVIDIFLDVAAPVPPGTLIASSVLVGNDSTIVATTVNTPLLGEPSGVKFSVTPPKDIAASQNVKITFLGSAGMKNPVEGNYKGYVRTTKEPIIMESPYYLITNAVSINSVTVNPPSTSTEAEYTIVIVTGEKLKKDIDSITIAFPSGTTLPTNIPPGSITLNATALLFAPTISSTTMTMLVPMDIPAATVVTIIISKSAKVKNPSTAGIYSLQVKTSTQPYYRVSPSYAIGTAVTNVTVTVSPPTKNSTNVQYGVDFKLGQNGALLANTDKIVIILKLAAPLPPTTLPASSVLVGNDYTIQNTLVELVGIAEEPGLAGYYRLTVYPPKDITANSTVKVTFLPSAGLQNPIAGNYKATVRTSQELILVESPYYQITDAVEINSINVQPPSTSSEAEYTINFTVGTGLLADIGTITVAFPSGTTIPTTIPVTGVTLTVGANPPVNLTINPTVSSGKVTITTPVAIPAASIVVLKFLLGAGIKNPSTPGLYKLQLMTSAQPYYRESPSYAIGSSVSNVKITPMPNNVSEINAEYKIEFKLGKISLSKNIDQLFVYLPVTTALLSIPPAGILVNGNFTELTSTITPVVIDANNYLEFGIYTPVDLASGAAVTEIILASCALTNPATENIYFGYVSTSQENIKTKSELYNIVDSVGFPGFNPPLDLRSVLPKPNAINLPAQYLIHFRTSLTKPPLTINVGTINVVFPAGTKVPGTISSGSIYISLLPMFGPGGPDALVCPPTPPIQWNIVSQPVVVSGQEVKIITPIQIPSGSNVYVLFCPSANIQNPQDAGLYTLQVKTSSQPNFGISRSYLIRSTVTKPVVTPVPAVTGLASEYTIRFKTGSQGDLLANTDKIFIAFDGTFFTTPIANIAPSSLKVNGVYMNVYANIGTGPILPPNVDNPPGWMVYRWIEIQTPIDIKESSEVTLQILLPAGLINPLLAGNYKIIAWTNKEPVAIDSEIFTIGDAITNVTIPPSYPNPKTASSIAEYFLTFTLGASPTSALSQALMSTITVTFPEGTKLPTTINPADIKIGVGGPPCIPSDSAIPPVSIEGQSIRFAVPISIASGSNVCVNFLKGAKIQNPDTPGSYRLTVKTSSQPIEAYSNYYTILSTSSIPKVIAEPPAINVENTAYSVSFKTGLNGSLISGIGKIVIFFDPNYIGLDYTVGFMANPSAYPGLYTSIPPNSIFVNDSAVTSITKVVNTAPVGGFLSYIELTTPIDIAQETDVTVKFSNITGIKNPPMVGNYRLAVLTSAEPTPVESVEFSLFSSISTPTVVLSVSDLTPPKPKGNSPNTIAQYSISFTTGPAGNLVYDIGTMTIQFPVDTFIPSSFSASSIKIKVGLALPVTLTQAPIVDLEKKTVTMKVPVGIPVNTAVEIIFTELAGLKNPTAPGNYNLYVSTSSEPLYIKSNPYLIEGISAATVILDPCLQNSSFVHYQIEFVITKALVAGNYIYVEFPYGTRLPSVIQGNDVLVNGKPADVGAFPQIIVNKQQVTVKVPDPLQALTTVKLEFLQDARVTNPASGNFTLKVRTDIDLIDNNGNNDPDDRWIESKEYFVCSNLTLKSLDINPKTITLAKAESKVFTVVAKDDQDREILSGLKYVWSVDGPVGTVSPNNAKQVTFKAGATAGSGKLSVTVTYGSSSLTVFADISVSASLASITISPTTASLGIGQTQVFTANALDELGNTMTIDFDWTIAGSIGSISPIKGKQTTLTATSEGTGSVKVKAVFGAITKEATASVSVSSSPPPPPPPPPAEGQAYTSVINPASVRANQGDVTFQISVSALKEIVNGMVEVNIPEGFPLPSRSPGGQGFVDAVATSPASISTPPTVNGRTVTINVVKMVKGNTFTLSYSRVSAPSTPGEYVFLIKGKDSASGTLTPLTDSPKVLVISIADGSGRATIQPTDGSAGAVGQKYTITYIADADMSGGAIQIVFPDGWSKPTLSPTIQGYVSLVDKTVDIGSLEVSDATVTIPIAKLGLSQKISILYSNVSIPNVPNTYTFVVRSRGLGGTFKNIVLSPTVTVANTRIDSAKVEVNPNMTTINAEYTISFKTSKSGFLAKDMGTITLVFPPETDIPNTINSETILVNGTKVTLPPEVDSIRSTIKIVSPLDAEPNTMIQVKFSLESGIKNPKTPKEDYKLRIYTSTDTVPSDSAPYKIIVSSLRKIKVTPSPIVPGASAQYRFQFFVGGGGALNVNQDSITFIFPSDTVLPSSIPANAVTVNATPLQTRPMIDLAQRKMTILLPVRIDNDAEVSVVINQEANVKNPSRDGMYKMKVFTSKEINPVESEAYQIGQSLLGDVKVSLSTSLVEATNVTYTISFRTGAFGALSVGDKVTITFDRRYKLPSIQAYQVTVNGVVCTVTPEISEGNSIIFNVPIGISSQSTATITISGVKNPSEAGEYSISLATKAEPNPVMSTPYRIGLVLVTELTINPSEPNGLAGWYTIAPNLIFSNPISTARIFYSWDNGSPQPYTGSSLTAPEGIHTLTYYSIAEGLDDETKKSTTIKVDTRAPVIRVTRPTESSTVNVPDLIVEGDVDEANNYMVTVNEKPATVTDKRFTITISLNPGENWVDIVAIDEAGNRSITPRIRITYALPSDIKINVTSPKSLSSLTPTLKPLSGGSYQLVASVRITGNIVPANATEILVFIMGKMETPIKLPIAADGSFDGTVELPLVAGMNGITLSVKDKVSGKEFQTSVAVIAKIVLRLQIGNALAFMNDKEYRLDAPPYIKGGRTMLPMRFIGETLGASVGWVPETKKVMYDLDTIHIELTIGSTTATVKKGDKTETIKLDAPPEVLKGRTFVPLRMISENLGADVKWEAATKKITVTK